MNTRQNEKEMFEWYDKHHAEHFTSKRKRHAVILPIEPLKKQLPRNPHYGEQPKKNQETIKEYAINGHTIKLWEDGLLSCDCKGWIFKRAGVHRECVHVRDIYGQLTNKPTPEKKNKSLEMRVAEKLLKLLEGD